MELNIIKSFLGWCCIINIIFLLFSTFIMTVFQKNISKIHLKLFALDETTLNSEYFKFLAVYKIAILVFNIVPYLALIIIS